MEEEKYEWEPEFIVTPYYVLRLLRSKVINPTEFAVLSVIQSLSRCEKGCFASNEYIAKLLGLSIDTVSKAITKLKKLGIIKQVSFNGRVRHLGTKWAEPPSEPAPDWSPVQPKESSLGSLRNRPYAPLRDAPTNNKGDRKGNNVVSLKSETPRRSAGERQCASSGFFKTNSKSSDDFEDICVKKLYTAIGQLNKVMRKPNFAQWRKSFKDLLRQDHVPRSQIEEVLNWYCENIGKEYVPDARSGPTFREKFDRIAAAMERSVDSLEPTPRPKDPMSDDYFPPGVSKQMIEREREEWLELKKRWPGASSCLEPGEDEDDEDDNDEDDGIHFPPRNTFGVDEDDDEDDNDEDENEDD